MTIAIYKAIDAIADTLKARGVSLPDDIKRRDPKEPGRAMKEQYEDKLMKLVLRRFRIQRRNIAAYLAHYRPAVKGGPDDFLGNMPDDLFSADDVETLLLRLFIAASQDGVELFSLTSTIGLDWSLVNTQAAAWAREYVMGSGKHVGLVNMLDDTTKDALRNALVNFVEVPGYTIGDVVRVLPLDEKRALRVAVTEITRIFSEADNLAGLALKEQFPDVRVVKTWFTSADDRVCPVCGPLHDEIGRAHV